MTGRLLFSWAFAMLLPGALWAQGTGLVGLMPPIPAQAPASAAKAAGPNKSVLSGPVGLALFYESESVQRIRVDIQKTFAPADQTQALTAARAVQRDLKQVCAKLCQPEPMPQPVMSTEGKLSFDLLLKGLNRKMSNTDMLAALEGRRLPATVPGSKPAEAASAAPATP